MTAVEWEVCVALSTNAPESFDPRRASPPILLPFSLHMDIKFETTRTKPLYCRVCRHIDFELQQYRRGRDLARLTYNLTVLTLNKNKEDKKENEGYGEATSLRASFATNVGKF